MNNGKELRDISVIDQMKRAKVVSFEEVDLEPHTNLEGRVNNVICLNADTRGNPFLTASCGAARDLPPGGWLKDALRNYSAILLIHPANQTFTSYTPRTYTLDYEDVCLTGLDMNMARVVSG